VRFLFVTYCFGSHQGQTLIGVYKRGLRVAMELDRLGHEIYFSCTGREGYEDELTQAAEKTLTFVDIPFVVASFDEVEENRRHFLGTMKEISPDIVVIGEAPLAGSMLESTLCAFELRVPLVFLDNAYNPLFVENFLRMFGPMADGIVLTGPSSHHMLEPPAHLCQVPPFVRSDLRSARRILRTELGLRGDRLVTVLAYDQKVERLAFSLARELKDVDTEFLFCARDPDGCAERLASLPQRLRRRIRVTPQPADSVLFGFLEVSRLAIVKYGFMQVSECLAMRTPVVAVFHEGPKWLDALPEVSRRLAFVTDKSEADAVVVEAALKLLRASPDELAATHDGRFDAVPRAALFLEQLPTTPRVGTEAESIALGFTRPRLRKALAAKFAAPDLRLRTWRSFRLRVTPEYELFMVVAHVRVNGRWEAARLWARRYADPRQAKVAHADARVRQNGGLYSLYYSARSRTLFADDFGEAELPVLNP
jgi:hypothetical protein